MSADSLEFRIEHIENKGRNEEFMLLVTITGKNLSFTYKLFHCSDKETLLSYVKILKEKIENILSKAKALEEPKERQRDLAPEQLWKEISAMNDEEAVSFYNSLDEQKRREFADFVFSHCNVFSGKGRLFSERFDSETNTLK